MKPETVRLLAALPLWPALALSLSLTMMLPRAALADDAIQAWTDESGRVHYSNRAAERAGARTLQAPPVPSAEETVFDRQRAERAREALTRWQSRRDAIQVVDPSQHVSCERALHILGFLREYPELPVLRPLDDGQVTLLLDDERHHTLDRAQADIRQRCQFATEVDMNDLWSGLFWQRTARAGHIVPTQFLPRPAVREPNVEIRGGRPRTTPANPVTSLVNTRRPVAPVTSNTSITGSRRPLAPNGSGGVSFR